MSQDGASEPLLADLPAPVSEWLAETAAEHGLSETDILGLLLAESDEVDGDVGDVIERVETIEERLDELEATDPGESARLEEIEARLDEVDERLDQQIDDVRDRVIQVKREADGKAPEAHDHPEYEERLEEVGAELDDVLDHLEVVDDRIEETTDRTETLRSEVEDLSADVGHKLDVLAAAVLDLRERVAELTADRSRRAALAELRRAANRHGTRTAECAACGESVDLGLLSEPACPHCEEDFGEFSPKEGFFGSHTLETGAPPALEGEVVDQDDDLADIVEE